MPAKAAANGAKGGAGVDVTLQRQAVRMARLIGTASRQAVAEATLELPAALPDIARVVRVAARPVVTGWEAGDDEVVVQGAVDFVIIYAHEREERAEARDIEAEPGYGLDDDVSAAFDPVEYREVLYRHRWRRGGVFEAVLDVPGAHPGAAVEVAAFPEDMDVQLHHDGRGVDVEVIVSVRGRVKEYQQAEVFVRGEALPQDAEADVQETAVEHVRGGGATHLSVQGTLPVDADVPLARVVDVWAAARASAEWENPGGVAGEARRVVVSGSVDYRALCVDENGDLVTVEWHGETPFTYRFELEEGAAGGGPEAVSGGRSGAGLTAVARVSGVDAFVVGGGRQVELFADVELTVQAAAVLRLPLLVGLAGPEGTEIHYRTATFGLEEWIGEGTADERLQQTLELPPGHPPVDRLLAAEAHAAVEDVLVLGDKIIAEGYVDVGVLYVARTEGQPVHFAAWRRAVPLEAEVPLAGAEPGMEAEVDAEVASVELDLLSREAVEADVRVEVRAKLTRPVEREAIVEAVAVPPPEEDPPTFTFVVIQPGDTLWKLSRRYHADLDEILRVNPWLEDGGEGPLPPGRKLCVPRRRPVAQAGAG